jgi:hypothetical protein
LTRLAKGRFELWENAVWATTTFTAITREGGVAYHDLDAEIRVDLTQPAKDVGKGVTQATSGHLNITMSTRFPADYSTGPVRQKSTYDMKVTLVFQGPGGVERFTTAINATATKTMKYLTVGGKNLEVDKKTRTGLVWPPFDGGPAQSARLERLVARQLCAWVKA